MRIYVAGPMADLQRVREVQSAVRAAGHQLTLDWTRDMTPLDFGAHPLEAGAIAVEDLDAAMSADAVLVVESEHEGRGVFVELGAALARACRGDLAHLVIVGEIHHESVFHFHPVVERVDTVHDWLAGLDEVQDQGPPPAKVVTLCGSTRFESEFAEVNQRLTLEGYVVISVGMFDLPDLPDYDWVADTSDLRGRLGRVHLEKVRLADEVFVVDPGGYVGESTRREIAYAESLGKPVRYLSQERSVADSG